jgi:hypothetical protein
MQGDNPPQPSLKVSTSPIRVAFKRLHGGLANDKPADHQKQVNPNPANLRQQSQASDREFGPLSVNNDVVPNHQQGGRGPQDVYQWETLQKLTPFEWRGKVKPDVVNNTTK